MLTGCVVLLAMDCTGVPSNDVVECGTADTAPACDAASALHFFVRMCLSKLYLCVMVVWHCGHVMFKFALALPCCVSTFSCWRFLSSFESSFGSAEADEFESATWGACMVWVWAWSSSPFRSPRVAYFLVWIEAILKLTWKRASLKGQRVKHRSVRVLELGR